MSTLDTRTVMTEARPADVALWDDVMRAYAAVLDEQRALLLSVDAEHPLDLDGVALPWFEPPGDLPAMPDELRGRAHALLVETQGLAALAREVLAQHPIPGSRTFARGAGDGGSALDQKL